ncbi:MAG: hypothetical protein ACJAZQ_003175 [Cognaticolwellia sp.]|jgi:hypothetical protein
MRTLFKWLVITVVVVVVFLIFLLALGYLLKENEKTTQQLKIKSTQDAQIQQVKEARKQALFQIKPTHALTPKLTLFEQSQQKIITDNSVCQSKKECFLVQTNSQALGCIVVVNATGIAILLKTASELNLHQVTTNDCQQAYSNEPILSSACQNYTCSIAR